MARPLRVEFPGACYHVICRGNQRLPVLVEERDREVLLERLVHFAELFRVRIRSYCLMVNHFHAYVQTEDANLGRFMHALLTSFTVNHNRRHETSGHVFQGRYKAFVVEDGSSYASEVSRYIHLNPARIPALEGAPTADLQRAVRDCRWSSYGETIGLRRCPGWLRRDDVLRGWGDSQRERQTAYARFVEQGLTADLWDPWEAAAAQTIIGSDGFVDRIRRSMADVAEDINARSESGQGRALQGWCTLAEVQAAVARVYGCTPEALLRRHSRGNEARQVLLYLAAAHCRGRQTLSALGQQLGPVTAAMLSRTRSLLGERLGQSPALARRVAAVENELRGGKGSAKG